MQTQPTPITSRRLAHRPIQLVMVRANGPLFYSVAAAALLESGVTLYAGRMLHLFSDDPALCDWIRTEWLPRKAARAETLRNYVEATWPEFDYGSALEEYRASIEGDACPRPRRPTAAHEALARCVGAAQTALFYRCLARWAEDPRLREMARVMAQEEASSLPRFRAAFESRAKSQRFGFAAAWHTARACVRRARDVSLPLAFDTLGGEWGPNAPFPQIDYSDFVARMRAMIERLGDLGRPERLLFRPWASRPSVRIQEAAKPAAAWFKPFFRAAA